MSNEKKKWWFVFYQNKILLNKKEGLFTIPFSSSIPFTNQTRIENTYNFKFKDKYSCVSFEIEQLPEEFNDDEAVLVTVRDSYDYLPLWAYQAAGKSYELLYWDKNSQFCPRCGHKTERIDEILKQCPNCNKEQYPAVQPAMIVLIQKEDKILLAHAHNFKKEFHSLIAGFLETGETLEECVRREVKEETGLSIKNIRYFGNQPWPYPSVLMVGFIADYESGEITIQEEELRNAAFYSINNLPTLPQKLSLARKMIDWWLEQKRN